MKLRLLKYTGLLVAITLPLMAATKCNETIASIAVKTCSALDVIYQHYDQVKADGVIPVRYSSRVDAIRTQTDKACVNPAGVNTIVLAGLAGEAYIALRAAFKAGEGQGDADYEATQGLNKLEDLKVYLQELKKE